MTGLRRSLWTLLCVQIVLCVLSLGFTPAILIAFALMLAAPVSFLRSMAATGMAFIVSPFVVGMLVLQEAILAPVFLAWFVLIIVASAVCWNRGPDKPQFLPTDSQ